MSNGNEKPLEGEMGGKISVVLITPDMARQLLDRGGRNRPIRNNRVKKYAEDMKEGRWPFNGDAIKISKVGEVLDGKHRLLACIEAGVPFLTLIVYDLDESVFITIDDNGVRTLADALAIESVPNYTTVAAALGWVWLYDKGALSFDQRPSGPSRGSKRQLLSFYKKCDATAWQQAAKVGQQCRSLTGSVGIATACHFVFQRHSKIKADEFFEKLLFGAGGTEEVIETLRKRLMKDRFSMRHERLKAGSRLALIFKTWNAFVTGKLVGTLKVQSSKSEKFPVAVVSKGNGKSAHQ